MCAGASGFIIVVNSFVVGLFLFFWTCHYSSQFGKTKNKKVHVMVLLWIWRAVWKDQLAFEDHILKPGWFFFLSFFWLLLCLTPLMTRNQVEMQCADETRLSDSRALSPHAVFLYVSAFLAWPQFIYIKGKSAAVVTLGNILLPVLVAHIWPLL